MNNFQEQDAIRESWKMRINNGLKGAKIVDVVFTFPTKDGFVIDSYILPFEKDRMKTDIDEWKHCKISKTERSINDFLQE